MLGMFGIYIYCEASLYHLNFFKFFRPVLWLRTIYVLILACTRPQRWSIFQSDGMVNVFLKATIDFDGFSMVLTPLDHHHWMFFESPTIGFNGFSMVFEISRSMVNDGLDVPLDKKVREINSRQNARKWTSVWTLSIQLKPYIQYSRKKASQYLFLHECQ